MIIVIVDTLEQFDELRGCICPPSYFDKQVYRFGKCAVHLHDDMYYVGWCSANWYARNEPYNQWEFICYKEYKRRCKR